MSTTQIYKVIINNTSVKNRISLFGSTLARLKIGTIIELINISGIWGYFKYQNKDAYILTFYLEIIGRFISK